MIGETDIERRSFRLHRMQRRRWKIFDPASIRFLSPTAFSLSDGQRQDPYGRAAIDVEQLYTPDCSVAAAGFNLGPAMTPLGANAGNRCPNREALERHHNYTADEVSIALAHSAPAELGLSVT